LHAWYLQILEDIADLICLIPFSWPEESHLRTSSWSCAQSYNRRHHKPLFLQFFLDLLCSWALLCTFRTLFRTSEAILEEPLLEGRGGAIYRFLHAL